MRHRPGTGTNARFVSPICSATPNMPSTAETPASPRGFTSCCSAPLASGTAAPISKIPPSPSTKPTSTADFDRLLAVSPTTAAGRQLARGIRKCRGDLFIFVTHRDVPATNNQCERALRPSVIFRKVTGGFRSQWGARTYADALSVIATGRLHGRSALQALRDALAGRPILVPP